MAEARCIDVDLTWIAEGAPHWGPPNWAPIEREIKDALARKGWHVERVESDVRRYCRDDERDTEEVLAEAREIVGEKLGKPHERAEDDGGPTRDVLREAHRIAGEWVVVEVTDA